MGIVLYYPQFFTVNLLSHLLFLVSQFLQMIQDWLFSPRGRLLTPEWFRVTLGNLLWHYCIFKALHLWMPAITKIIIPSHLQTPILPLIPGLKMPHSAMTPHFITSPPNYPCVLSYSFLKFLIPVLGFFTALYIPPKTKCNPEPSVSKNMLKQPGVISYLFPYNSVCHATNSPIQIFCDSLTHLLPTISSIWFKIF